MNATKEQAIALVKEMAEAAVHCYAVINKERRGKPEVASVKENKAANKLLTALGHTPLTDAEWNSILG